MINKDLVIIGGGSVGCETADYLAPLINDLFPANRDVTVIEMTNQLMIGEGGAAKSKLTRRLMEKGVHLELSSTVDEVTETTIKYTKKGVQYTIDDADTLVFAVGYTPTPLALENCHVIGDANKVGNLRDAISSAYEFAKNL